MLGRPEAWAGTSSAPDSYHGRQEHIIGEEGATVKVERRKKRNARAERSPLVEDSVMEVLRKDGCGVGRQ